jgi:aryl-alcohol dehydrogenase-like predicted oxidoreductase
MKEEGKILNMGVSVEKIEQAIKAIEFENVASIQIIYNIFRQRPHERFFKQAAEKNVGIIVRVPLASGLLTGKFSTDSKFEKGDHRFFNRAGEAFDKGETFSGVPYETGLQAVEELREALGDDVSLLDLALKWILMKTEVSCVIPGASKVEQVTSNVVASGMQDLNEQQLIEIDRIYEKYIKEHVHQLW